jgi:hypothetical protein
MTANPEFPNQPENSPEKDNPFAVSVIEDIFNLGYIKSDPQVLFKDPNNKVELSVVYRTLMPAEIREIFESVSAYSSVIGQLVTEQLETLARAIITINGMPLILDEADRKKLAEELHVQAPTPLQQAKYILTHKIKSPNVVDLLYEAYREFTDGVKENFAELKKKLNSQTSSS